MRTSLPFWLLLVAIVLVLVAAPLVGYGGFMDGLLYNAVAHNQAQGYGSLWQPYFAKYNMSYFHEQPPLTFFIESLFFRALGSGLWVERVYSFSTLVLGGLGIAAIWKTVHYRTPNALQYAWLPLLFWVVTPCIHWAYSNYMEENTMSIFVLAAVWCQAQIVYRNKSILIQILLQIVAALCLVLGSLCKGFPALFPLGLMGAAWLSGFVSLRKASINTLLLIVSVVFFYGIIYAILPAQNNISDYLNARVFNSIKNVSTEQGRFWLAQHILEQLIPVFVAVGALLIINKQKLHLNITTQKANFAFFLLLGLAGSMPLMVTREQRGFYLATAIPYFAIAFASIILPILIFLVSKINITTQKYLTIAAAIMVFGATVFVATKVGGYTREADKWSDFFVLQQILPRRADVKIANEMWDDWELQCGMMRIHGTNFDSDTTRPVPFRYYLLDKTLRLNAPDNYSPMDLHLQRYELYQLK